MKYRVKINEKKREVSNAPVSAYPLNRVWPGHQRPKEQTSDGYFVNYDFEDKATIEIETEFDIESVEVRPTFLNAGCEFGKRKITVDLDKPIHISVEINGNKENICFFANTEKYSAEEMMGDVIYFGKGEHYPGVILPKSGQTVFIDEGAVVYGAIFIKEQKNVRIIGHGVLDASYLKRGIEAAPGEKGSEYADAIREMGLSQRDVEYSGMFVAYGCENVLVEGITLLNSMFWTMILRNDCRNITVNNVKIFGQWRYNSDGINICNSSDIRITNCFIRSFDDCVVVRGPFLDKEHGNINNVEVKNCVLWCDWGINMEIFCADRKTTISNVRFTDNYVIHASTIIMDVQTWFGSREAIVRDVLYENIMIDSNRDMLRPQYQSTDDVQYVFDDERYAPKLSVLQCGKIGRNLGNQQFEEISDPSIFHSLYENITYRGIVSREIYATDVIKNGDILTMRNVNFESISMG